MPGTLELRTSEAAKTMFLDLPSDLTEVVDGAHPVRADRLVDLDASVEPGAVFASLATQCVPDFCDDCVVDIFDGEEARYRIAPPLSPSTAGGLQRIAEGAVAAPDQVVRVTFAYQYSEPEPLRTPVPRDEAALVGSFHGSATFTWHRRIPTRSDRAIANLLVNLAVHTVLTERAEVAAHTASANAESLRTALQTCRRIGAAIGILMTRHKITGGVALELLQGASQRSNRKLRDLADDVVDTGWLDPALLPDGVVRHLRAVDRS